MPDIEQVWRDTIMRRYPDSSLIPHRDGSYTVVVPAVAVEGYQAPTLAVSFEIPVGFQLACPADFTTSPVMLQHGSQPAYTQLRGDGSALHWYHRLAAWDPQRDSLINYWGSILRRLHSAAQPAPGPDAEGRDA